MSRFKDRTILITGAATGMGRATAIHLAKSGARVALWGRRAAPLKELEDEINKYHGQAFAQVCDISNSTAIETALNVLSERFGNLDGVFANAGILGEFKSVSDTGSDDFSQLVSTNLIGTQQTVSQCVKRMSGGSIVINASWTADAVMPGTGAYAATKAGLIALMRIAAVEEGPRGIRVNSISPGIILTPMADEVLDPALSKRLSDHTPLRRNGRPEDVCGAVSWLLSDDAAFVTGQNVVIDGGYVIGGALR